MNRTAVRLSPWKCAVGAAVLGFLGMPGHASASVMLNTFSSTAEASRWTFNNGGEFPGARGAFVITSGAEGANSYGELRYDFTPPTPLPANFNPHYVQVIRSVDAVDAIGKTRARIRVWSGKSGARYFFRWVDSTGQTFQSNSIYAHTPEEPFFKTILFDLRTKSFSWGGANDGVVHFPITKVALVSDATGLRNTGWLRFDDVELLPDLVAEAATPFSEQVINDFTVPGEDSLWRFSNGAEFPGARGGIYLSTEASTGTPYAELRYDFTPPSPLPANFNPHYVLASRTLSTAESAGHNTRLRFKAQKSRPEIMMNLRWVDATGQTLQVHVNSREALEQTAESLHETTIDLTSATTFWGGANDGITRFPLKSIAFICDATGFRDTGWIRFGGITLLPETTAPAMSFTAASEVTAWKFGNGGEFPGARGSLTHDTSTGVGCARLGYDFTQPAGWTGTFDPRYVEASRALPETASGVRLRFTVSATNIPVRLRYVDSAGQTFQATLTNGLASEGLAAGAWVERYLSFIPVLTRWGGPNDGVVRPPIKRMSIVLDAAGRRDTGYVKFDEVLVSTEPHATVELGSGTLVAPQWGTAPLRDRSGVSVHFTNDNRSMDAIRTAGFGWVRMDAYWDQIEKVAGQYNFTAFDTLVAAAEQRNMGVIAILNYGNVIHTGAAMTPPKTAAALTAYENYCAAMAARYAGKKVIFEVWNEPDVPAFWGGAPNATEFGGLLARGIAGVRRGNSNATVFSGGLSSIHVQNYKFFNTVIAGGSMSGAKGMGVHLYGSAFPELQWGNIMRLKKMAQSSTGGQLWCSEWGYSSTDLSPVRNGLDARGRHLQAKMAVRQLFVGWWANLPITVLYTILDDGPNSSDPEHNYGLLARDYSEKPAMKAVKKLMSVSAGRTLAGLMKPAELPNGMHIARLDGATDQVYMVWVDEATCENLLAIPNLRATAVDMYGNSLGLVRSGSRLTLAIKPDQGPVYVTVPRN